MAKNSFVAEVTFLVNFKTLCCCNSMSKIKKNKGQFFVKLEKPHFGHNLGPVGQKLQNKIFLKKKIRLCHF